MQLSVIICTHNPRKEYLEKTLSALRKQNLPRSEWELILIDNASEPPVAKGIDLSWHEEGRVISEPEPGLTPARIRGIRAAGADLLIFVDDDNVLFPDYLDHALEISSRFEMLGAWGGQIFPEFELEPSPDLEDFVPYLALREVKKARWTSYDPSMTCCPFGAGICVRGKVALRYVEKLTSRPIFRQMDRRKESLMGGGDVDLALTSFQLGLGIGVFPELKLTHLISRERVDRHYLYRLVAAGNYAGRLVSLLNDENALSERQGSIRKWIKTNLFALNLLHRFGKLNKAPLYYQAATVGVCQAEEDFSRIQAGIEPVGVAHLYTK